MEADKDYGIGFIKRRTRRVMLAASLLCEERNHLAAYQRGKAGSSCCGVCFNDMWPLLRKPRKEK